MILGGALGGSGLAGGLPTGTSDGLCRTEVTLSQAWECRLTLENQFDGGALHFNEMPPGHPTPTTANTAAVSVSGMGCTAALAFEGMTLTTAHGSPVGSGPFGTQWLGEYYVFKLTVSGPGLMNSTWWRFGVWIADGWMTPPVPGSVPTNLTLGGATLNIDVAMSVSGLYRKEVAAQNDLPTGEDRARMDWTDMTRSGGWYADSASQVTISAGGLTISGALASGEVALGTAGGLAVSWLQNRYPSTGKAYLKVSNIKFNDIAVDLDGLELWYSASEQGATRAPDQSSSNLRHWSRYIADADSYRIRCVDDGGIATRADGAALSSSRSWSGSIRPPTQANFKPVDGRHTDASDYPGIKYTGPVLEWALVGSTWTSSPKVLTGDYSATEQYRSWLFAHEWQVFSSLTGWYIDLDDDWREANGEAVGGANARYNDERCGILCHPRDADNDDRKSGTEPWWGPMVVAAHVASLDLNDPPGIGTRPSLWTGGDGVTVDVGDNDAWTVAAETVAPLVTRDTETRRLLREAALQAAMATPEWFNPVWLILTKANWTGDTGENPAWAAAVPYEDITDLEAFKYLRVGLMAPRAGTVTLTCYYTTPAVTDSATTCREHREITVERTAHTLTLSFAVEAGANTVLLDYAVPSEGACPVQDLRPNLVTRWEWQLPDAGGSDETWTLTEFKALQDPGEGERSEPTPHALHRYKRAWDWLSGNWTGFLGLHDGCLCLEMDDGTHHHAQERYGMQYIRELNHCPESTATGTLHFAKTLSALQGEINMREGYTTSAYPKPEESVHNKDATGAMLKGGFNWWEVRSAHHFADSTQITGCVVAGYCDLVEGIEQDVWFYAIPQGRVTGLATNRAGTARARSSGTVRAQTSLDGGDTWSDGGSATPDAHGRYELGPYTELNRLVRLVTDTEETREIVNREYSWLQGYIIHPPRRGDAVGLNCDPGTGIPGFAWVDMDGHVRWNQIVDGINVPGTAVLVDDSQEYSGAGYDRQAGVLYIVATGASDGVPYLFTSRDCGATWTAEGSVG